MTISHDLRLAGNLKLDCSAETLAFVLCHDRPLSDVRLGERSNRTGGKDRCGRRQIQGNATQLCGTRCRKADEFLSDARPRSVSALPLAVSSQLTETSFQVPT